MTLLTPSQWIETMEIIRTVTDEPLEAFGSQDVIVINLNVAGFSEDARKRLVELGWLCKSPTQIRLPW